MHKARYLAIDTDAGVDDAVALCYALQAYKQLGYTFPLITTTHGNCALRTVNINVAKVRRAMGLSATTGPEIVSGAEKPLFAAEVKAPSYFHGIDGMGDATQIDAIDIVNGEHKVTTDTSACDALLDLCRRAVLEGAELTVITLGPHTNIAKALEKDTELVTSAISHLGIMGGCANGKGNATRSSEFNVYADPEAAERVFSVSARFKRVTCIPWELTVTFQIPWCIFDKHAACSEEAESTEQGHFLSSIMHYSFVRPRKHGTSSAASGKRGEDNGAVICDFLATVVVLNEEAITSSQMVHVDVELTGTHTRGSTIVDFGHSFDGVQRTKNVRWVMSIDSRQYIRLFERLFCGIKNDSELTATDAWDGNIAVVTSTAGKGYLGFGSFFSENVEVLIEAASSSSWVSPRPLINDDDLLIAAREITEYGTGCRNLFPLDLARWTYVNHGAFGGACLASLRASERLRLHAEINPVQYIDRELFPQVVECARQLSKHICCSPRDIVLLPNVTTALNVVLRAAASLNEENGRSRVLVLDVGYGGVRKMVEAATGQEAIILEMPMPPCRETLLAAIEEDLKLNASRYGLAIFDAVTSNTALRLPFEDIVDLCRRYDVPSMIDGAHALGALSLNLSTLGADFFAGNCHKHYSAAKGTAFLYVCRNWQHCVRPLCASHGTGSGFWSEFIWDGCRDYAGVLSLSTTLKWWASLPGGCVGAMEYMTSTRQAAVELITQQWQTECFTNDTSMLSNMALVALPTRLQRQLDGLRWASTSANAKSFQDWLHFEKAIECPVKCISGRLYVRITSHIYNTIDDYVKLVDAIASDEVLDALTKY